jgi:hypothetical protein
MHARLLADQLPLVSVGVPAAAEKDRSGCSPYTAVK